MTKRRDYEEIAREWDEAIESGAVDDELTPSSRKLAAKEPRAVAAVRMSHTELETISKAAAANGLNFSEFMRQSAMAAAHGELKLATGELQHIKQQARELAESVSRL